VGLKVVVKPIGIVSIENSPKEISQVESDNIMFAVIPDRFMEHVQNASSTVVGRIQSEPIGVAIVKDLPPTCSVVVVRSIAEDVPVLLSRLKFDERRNKEPISIARWISEVVTIAEQRTVSERVEVKERFGDATVAGSRKVNIGCRGGSVICVTDPVNQL